MKKNITHYISELLFIHDCVIIPGFGGFVGNDVSAKINKDTGAISPPSKQILFNKNLTNNDGLLINHIAQQENLSQEKIKKSVFDFKENLNSQLGETKNIRLEKIGLFSLGSEGNLTFAQDHSANYSLESFGMKPIQKQSTQVKKINKPSQERKYSSSKKQGSKSTRKIWRAAAILLPLIGLSLASILKQQEIDQVYSQMADMNPFNIIANEVVSEELIDTKVIVPENIFVKHYIIAGSFQEDANAKKMMTRLQELNYNPAIVGKNPYGSIRICYDSYNTREDALLALQEIRKINESAWLLSQ